MLRFWHFIDNEDAGVGSLIKIQLIVDQVNNTMRTIYSPGKNLSIDESLMRFGEGALSLGST